MQGGQFGWRTFNGTHSEILHADMLSLASEILFFTRNKQQQLKEERTIDFRLNEILGESQLSSNIFFFNKN